MEKMVSTTDLGQGNTFHVPLTVLNAIRQEVKDFNPEEMIESGKRHYAIELLGPDGHTNAMILTCYGNAPDISARDMGSLPEQLLSFLDDDKNCLRFDFTLGTVPVPADHSYAEEYDRLSPTYFCQSYRCYSFSRVNKAHLEKGDAVIMPPSALHDLHFRVEHPLLYELMYLSMTYCATDRITHCGVLDFLAADGQIYLPDWMMKKMCLQEGDTVQARNAVLSKGTFVKLQPHTKDFLDIPNPIALLMTTLSNFTCLTTGDTIMLDHNNKTFFINVAETKPSPAVRYNEIECEVELAPPLDFVPPLDES